MKHATLLRAMLTSYPLNTIFVTVKYDNRTDSMIKDFERTIDPLYKSDVLR